LTVLFDPAFVAFKSFAVIGDFDIAHIKVKLECGPMPNLMVALLNTGGALCSTPQSLADAHYLTAVQ